MIMAVIIKEIRLRGSCIHPELARALGTIEPLPEPMEFSKFELKSTKYT